METKKNENQEVVDQAALEVKNEIGKRFEALEQKNTELEQKNVKLEESVTKLRQGLGRMNEAGMNPQTENDPTMAYKSDLVRAIDTRTFLEIKINPRDFEKKDVNRMDVNTLGGFLNRVQYQTPIDETVPSDITQLLKHVYTDNIAYVPGYRNTHVATVFDSDYRAGIEKRPVVTTSTPEDATITYRKVDIKVAPYKIHTQVERYYLSNGVVNGQQIGMSNIVSRFQYQIAKDMISQNPLHDNIEGISDALITAGRTKATASVGVVKAVDLFGLLKELPSAVSTQSVLVISAKALIDIWVEETGLEQYKNFDLFANSAFRTVLNNIPIIAVDDDVLPLKVAGVSQTGKVVAILGNLKRAYRGFRTEGGRVLFNHEYNQAEEDLVKTIYEENLGYNLVEPKQVFGLTLA